VVYCVQAQLAFSTAARRDTVLSDITSRIAGKARWSVDTLQADSFRFGVNGIRVELRFTSRANADDLVSRIESFAVNARAPLAGSWLQIHNCPHDEGTDGCVVDARKDW